MINPNSCDQKKHAESLKSRIKASNAGPGKGKSSLPSLAVDTAGITSPSISRQLQSLSQPEDGSAMPGSLPPHKKKIWKDRLSCSELDTLTMKLSKMLEAASTSKERDLKPFWDSHLEESYKSLWLPTKTDYADLGSSSSANLCDLETGKSWFSMTRKTKLPNKSSAKTCSPSLQFSVPESTVSEVGRTGGLLPVQKKQAKKGKAKSGAVKCLRIRLFPGEELDWVMQAHSQSRWMYNAALSICYQHFGDVSKLESVSETKLRDLVQHYRYSVEDSILSSGETIQYKEFKHDESYTRWPTCPGNPILHNRIARGAVVSFARALNAGLSNLKAGNIRKFEMGYKSRKHSPTYTTFFEDKSFPKLFKTMKSMYCYTKKWKGGNRRTFTTFQDIFSQDTSPGGFTLEYDCLTDKHYILYTVPSDWYPSNDRRRDSQTPAAQEKGADLVSCDPGVRTFLSCYSPTGHVTSIGEAANQDLYRLLEHADKLKAEQAPERDIRLINRKIRNMCNDLHWKAAKFLASNYKVILLPHFRTAEMLRGRKLSKRTKRQMQAFSFFQFKEKLAFQCHKYKSHLVLVEEDYTSKTCGACGEVKWDLKGEKTFTCDSCRVVLDRDENGARNILLKNLRGVLA